MATMQSLKRRIKSAKNIKQITKAMEMVAASKMRRAQSQALASRPYARKLETTLATIATLTGASEHPLLEQHTRGDNIIVLFSTDKSLAGSLNTNLFRGLLESLRSHDAPTDPQFVIIGQKARQFVVTNGFELKADFSGLPDPITFSSTTPISQYLINGYLNQEFKSVTLAYMDFVSTLVQRFRTVPLLPFTAGMANLLEHNQVAVETQAQYMFEPSAQAILDWLLPYYIEMIVYQTMLETRASEHSARMVAMKNASENASEIIADLTLSYNKQRQAKITSELLDNTTAALAVS